MGWCWTAPSSRPPVPTWNGGALPAPRPCRSPSPRVPSRCTPLRHGELQRRHRPGSTPISMSSARLVLGKADPVVAGESGARPAQVSSLHRLENGPVAVDGLGQINALAFYLLPHHRPHLAVEHAPQVFQPAPP